MAIDSLSNEELMQIAGSPAQTGGGSPFDFIPSWLQATPPAGETPWNQQSLSQQITGVDLPTFARAAIKTAPLNAGDKIQAAIASMFAQGATQNDPEVNAALNQNPNLYQTALGNIQAGNNAASAANPKTYMAGQLGGALMTVPLMEAFGAPAALTTPANSMIGRLAQSSALGAGFGYGGSNAEDKTFDTSLGALAGLGGGVIGEALSPLLRSIAPGAESEVNNISSIAKENGTPAASIPDEVKVSFKDNVAQGLTPQQALTKAQGDRFGVRLSSGDVTQDVDQQGLEHLALTGSLGQENKQAATEFAQGQKEDLQKMATNIAKQVGGGQTPINNYADIAGNIQTKLQELNDQAKAGVNKAYEIANKAGNVSIPVQAFKDPMNNAINVLKNEYGADPALTPATSKAIDKIQGFFESNPDEGYLPFKTADNFRKVLNKYYQAASNDTDRAGISILQRQLNNVTDDAVNNGLVNGNPEAITAIKNANQVAADYFNRFDSNKIIQNIIDKDMQPETVAKMLFGAGKLGGNTEAATVTNQLKNLLGENSPEFQQIKQAGIDKLFYGNLPASSYSSNPALAKNIAGQYAKNVDEFFNGNKSLADSLYTPEEQQTILDSAKYVAKPIATRQPGSINNSGTYPVMARAGMALKKTNLPVIEKVGEAMRDASIIHRLGTHFEGGTIVPLNNYTTPGNLANALKQGLANATSAPIAATENELVNGPVNSNASPLSALSNEELIKAAAGQTSEASPEQALPPVPVVNAPPAPSANPVLSGIDQAAKATGVAAPLLHVIAAAESNLNPSAKNPNSSAKGLFQMTQSTWKQMVNKYGDQLGVGYKDINDPQANALMAAMLTKDNAVRMQNKLGRAPNPGEIYLAHFMGVPGAVKLMTADPETKAVKLFPAAAQSNRAIFFDGKNPKTVAEVYHDITGKVNDLMAPAEETKPAPVATPEQKIAINQIPQEAKDALITHPDKADQFDAAFGNGLAELILVGGNVSPR